MFTPGISDMTFWQLRAELADLDKTRPAAARRDNSMNAWRN